MHTVIVRAVNSAERNRARGVGDCIFIGDASVSRAGDVGWMPTV
jgi:hypothetical protein